MGVGIRHRVSSGGSDEEIQPVLRERFAALAASMPCLIAPFRSIHSASLAGPVRDATDHQASAVDEDPEHLFGVKTSPVATPGSRPVATGSKRSSRCARSGRRERTSVDLVHRFLPPRTSQARRLLVKWNGRGTKNTSYHFRWRHSVQRRTLPPRVPQSTELRASSAACEGVFDHHTSCPALTSWNDFCGSASQRRTF